MSKPFTIDDLSNQIQDDRTWRIREISDLSDAVQRADAISQRVLLRALVTICYAHWEGYVRYSAQKYIEHIAIKKLAFSTLSAQFTRNHFLPRLSALSSSKVKLRGKCELIDEILELSSKKFSRINPDLINTRSNLSFEVFSDICLICDLPPDLLGDKQTFIDIMLLKRRNAIAHGEDAIIDAKDRDDIANGSIDLMRRFGDAIENHVCSNSFRR
jgi:hypothetical protein